MTKTQRKIIDKMRSGYTLVAYDNNNKAKWSLQPNGVGSYEDGIPCSTITCNRLIRERLIQRQKGLFNIFVLSLEDECYDRI